MTFDAGAFSIYLGQVQALDPSLFADSAVLYLGVKVGNDDELQPFPIAHTPRALWSEQAGDANTLQGLDPDDFLAADYIPDWSELSNIPVELLDAIEAGLERDVSETNELITTVQLNGAQLDITEAGQTYSVDLSVLSDGVIDADADLTNELNTTVVFNGTSLEITDAGGTLSADLSSLEDDADADPANELNTAVVLNGMNLEITDSGGTLSADLSSLEDDADADPSNELNTTVLLNGMSLEITDAGGTLSADLSSLQADADASTTNELNTTVTLNGTSLEITDAGGTLSADLSSLQADADADSTNELQDLASVLGEGTDAGGANATNLGSVTATQFFNSNNTATGTNAIAIGGANTEALGNRSAILGGQNNIASGAQSFIGGGNSNYSSGSNTVVAGGDRNRIAAEVTCDATHDQSVNIGCLGAGDSYFDGTVDYDLPRSCVTDNTLCYSKSSGSSSSTIGGGRSNHINNSSILSTISGGGENYIASSSDSNVIGGGFLNTIGDFASRSVIGGGLANVADAFQTVIGGGKENYVVGRESVVGGGANNYAAGIHATIPGGQNNETGADHAFAAGRNAKALHKGAFVWGDSNGGDVSSTANNQFIARASGGFTFYSNGGASAGAQLTSGPGSWSSLSDRNSKENFEAVDGRNVLKRVAALPMATWNYKSQDKATWHMGPTAEDFHAAFGLGESKKLISSIDADGVCLASVQGLYQVFAGAESGHRVSGRTNPGPHQASGTT